ncbi:HigA family addiction module antitoxin [Candidatus Halobeggiatoa sp. HSG11]|nr:HigA family addiction module antitoxin [Candidatus Halobeggiatoa sp. HSG11]
METRRCKTKEPTHPGALLREIILPELEMTQIELARYLGVSRYTITEIIHERKAITPDMALRLGQFFDNGARLWLNMQQNHDLWQLEQSKHSEYQKIQKYAVSVFVA